MEHPCQSGESHSPWVCAKYRHESPPQGTGLQKGQHRGAVNSLFSPPRTLNLLVLFLTSAAVLVLVLVLGVIICRRIRRASLEKSKGTSDLGFQAVALLCGGVPPAHHRLPSRSHPRGEQGLGRKGLEPSPGPAMVQELLAKSDQT